MNNKRTILTIAPIVAAVLLLIMTTTTQTTQASIPTTPLHHKFPDKVAGYDDCSFLSESAKINHIRNCYGYDDTRLYTSTLDHSPSPFQQPDTPQSLQIIQQQNPSVTTACIDNTGSVQDEGYGFGYNDAQNGRSIASAKDHGNHTDEWRTGYRDGWMAGAYDLTAGVHKDPC